MVRTARFAALLAPFPHVVLGHLRVDEPAQEPGVHALRSRRPVHGRLVLSDRSVVRRRESLRATRLHSGQRSGAQSAATELLDDDPPAHALSGVHVVHGSVRVRHRGAGEWAAELAMDQRHPEVDPPVVVLPRDRDRPGDALGLRGAGMGRVLVLGSSGERVPAAVAIGHRVPPFHPDPGKVGGCSRCGTCSS